jgi:hypothetical protein
LFYSYQGGMSASRAASVAFIVAGARCRHEEQLGSSCHISCWLRASNADVTILVEDFFSVKGIRFRTQCGQIRAVQLLRSMVHSEVVAVMKMELLALSALST